MVAGRPPKPDDQKVTRHPLTHQWVDVPDVPFTGGPDLEQLLPFVKWQKPALVWWEPIRMMPHCVLWIPAQWAFAATAALIVQELHAGDGAFNASMLGQLVRREIELGVTEAARRQQRIRYVPAVEERKSAPAAPSAKTRQRRNAVLRAVADAS